MDALRDVIYVDGRSLPKKVAPKMYFALNKPKGWGEAVPYDVLANDKHLLLNQGADYLHVKVSSTQHLDSFWGVCRYICSSDTGGSRPVLSLFDEYFKIWVLCH